MKYLSSISFVFVLSIGCAYAQKDTTRLSFKKYYKPTGVRFGTDVLSLTRSQYDKSYEGWEVNADVDFYRYYLSLDYGSWGRNFTSDNGMAYSNNGNYWRAGIDVNFLTRDPDRNMFFIGARYARVVFDEDFLLMDTRLDGEPFTENYTNRNLTARWTELTTGVRVKIWKNLWMGYTARFKFGLKKGESEDLEPHDVPGYGRIDKDSYWGFNYQILFRIPVRPYPELPPKKKRK